MFQCCRKRIAGRCHTGPRGVRPVEAAARQARHQRRRHLAEDPDLHAAVQQAVDRANAAVSRAESVRRFGILEADFAAVGAELTPTQKVRRHYILGKYATDIDALYTG